MDNVLKYLSNLKRTIFAIPILLSGCAGMNFSNYDKCDHPVLPEYKDIKVALVLGGGGVKGMAHIAVLEELNAAGIQPDLVVGCSAGAIIGALYADGVNLHDLREDLFKQTRSDLLEFTFDNLTFGLSQGEALRSYLAKHLKSKNIEDMKIPFVAVATNLEFGDLVAFGKNSISDAVMASAAFPGVFQPVNIDGVYYVDGGVANPCPVETARKLGAEYVIAVDLSGDLTTSPPNHLFGVAKRSLEISYLHRSKLAVKDADFVISIPFKGIEPFEDGCQSEIYKMGQESIKASIADLKKDLRKKRKLDTD
jgi:NTE family protein